MNYFVFYQNSPFLWSDPVGARRRRAKALRRRAPLGSGILRVARSGSRAKAPPLAARPESCELFQGQPHRFALRELVPHWYKSFSPDHLVRRKLTTQPYRVIQLVPHNLVRRIRSRRI